MAAAVDDVNPLLDETRFVVVVDVDGFDVHAPVSKISTTTTKKKLINAIILSIIIIIIMIDLWMGRKDFQVFVHVISYTKEEKI